ncbi:penicillin V acylase-like amidase (Ntn superfamily) [Aliiruegeria haliotis]|uniref:Penicillin V acylase-like amidase (Ntn superfamily) n=1 Tax=Aliiruegeria haliotis TaxID=1280846 RepID=A0A2T0S0I3_9RHOB|nr:linear amide C-N hydrolase [Aliiruegeria haliotis]PRY26938.1 penicillin V acylase-like amidase (Ntn superfamily) [Aliiruegeria haliotis]
MTKFTWKSKIVSAVLVAALSSTAITANACSAFVFDTPQGNQIQGRTMELGFEAGERFMIAPRFHDLKGVSGPIGYVGMRHADTEWVSSGMNEHGLSVEGNALAASSYAPEGENHINYLNIGAHVLANAKSVDEAVEILRNTKVSTTKIAVAHGVEVGMHFSIADTERRIVVEWQDGSGYPEIFENHVGAMTNDPIYQEQLGNVMAMLDMQGETLDTAQATISEQTFSGFDKSSQGRFEQAAALNHVLDQSVIKSDLDAVNTAWSMVNVFDIPRGTLYWRWLDPAPQMVGYSIVADTGNADYYFRTYDNQEIRKVDVDGIDWTTVKYTEKPIFGTLEGVGYTDFLN